MSTQAHTPGPWDIAKDDWWVYSRATGKIIVDEIETENEADYRLVAAAPELLDALSELVDLMRDVIDGDYKPDSFTLQPAQAAIAKAEGRS
jgi:hypothetical protein